MVLAFNNYFADKGPEAILRFNPGKTSAGDAAGAVAVPTTKYYIELDVPLTANRAYTLPALDDVYLFDGQAYQFQRTVNSTGDFTWDIYGFGPGGDETVSLETGDWLTAYWTGDEWGVIAQSNVGAGGGAAGNAEDIAFTPAGNISSENVQDAIVELDTEKVGSIHNHTLSQVIDAGELASQDEADLATAQADFRGTGVETLPAAFAAVVGAGSLPVADTTALVSDPIDPTRRMRIDVGAVAASTTRVLSMGNRDVNLALGGTFLENRTIGIADGNLVEADGAPANGEFAVWTATGVDGLSVAETKAALAITVADITNAGSMALESTGNYTPTDDLGALALLEQVDTAQIAAGAVQGSQKYGDVQNETTPVANVSTTTLAAVTDHLTLTDGDTQTLVLQEPDDVRNLSILNLTGNTVEVQDHTLSAVATLADDHILLLSFGGTSWDVKADIATLGGGTSQTEIVDGTAGGGNITEITAAVLGTAIYRIVQFDQAMALDNALPADTAFALWNTHASNTLTVTIEAGAGGQGLFDDGASTVDIPPNGVMTLVVEANAGDEPAIMKRGDHVAVNFAGRPAYGGSVLVASVSGTLDASHIGGRWTTSGSVTIPNTQFGADEADRAGWFWCVLVLGANTHDITFNSLLLDVSGQSWAAGDKLSITVTSATTIEIERTAVADITTQAVFI